MTISTHTPLAGRDTILALPLALCHEFLLTRPSRDVTLACPKSINIFAISTHTPLAGRDYYGEDRIGLYYAFLLTRPSRDVTDMSGCLSSSRTFLLTRPSRDVTAITQLPVRWTWISTHTPLAGRDFICYSIEQFTIRFLLTRPSRDVTVMVQNDEPVQQISTHTPLAGRDVWYCSRPSAR